MRGEDRIAAPGSMVLLTRLAKQVYRRSGEQLLGMHLRLFVTLSYLRDNDSCPQQELAEALCMDANNVVLLLNELEQLRYVIRRRDLREEARVDIVDLAEGCEVGHVHGQPQRASERGPRRLADRRQVLQAYPRLLGGRVRGELAGGGVERDLTRAEKQLARAHRVAVGPDRRRRSGRLYGRTIDPRIHTCERTAAGARVE